MAMLENKYYEKMYQKHMSYVADFKEFINEIKRLNIFTPAETLELIKTNQIDWREFNCFLMDREYYQEKYCSLYDKDFYEAEKEEEDNGK